MTEVLKNIQKIRTAFMDTQLFYTMNNNGEALIHYLENAEATYRSVAYESASMSIALHELQNGHTLNAWLVYANGPAIDHKAQVHVGLGWAIAKLNIDFIAAVEKIEAGLYYRVADGCGYYDGCFRQRQTITDQQLPVYLPAALMPAYYQGIGRSLWYTCNADIHEISNSIKKFPANRHADLWRGLGIAVAYVGGCSDDGLRKILQYAGTNGLELSYGAALAVRSRSEANTMTADAERCSQLWYGLTAGKENISSLSPVKILDEKIYFDWVGTAESFVTNKI